MFYASIYKFIIIKKRYILHRSRKEAFYMAESHVWLNQQLFSETQAFMGMTNAKLGEVIRQDLSDTIFSKIQTLRSLMSGHCKKGANTPKDFLDEWIAFNTIPWAFEKIEILDRLIKTLERTETYEINSDYETYLDSYASWIEIKTRFATDTIKKIKKSGSAKNPFKDNHAKTFVRHAMIPFFKSAENESKFREYLEFLKNTDILLNITDKDRCPFSQKQIDTIKEPVDLYIEICGYEFKEEDFFNLMCTLFNQLLRLSDQDESEKIKETNERILKNVMDTYIRYMVQRTDLYDLLVEESTSGIPTLIFTTLLESAAEDTLTAYWNIYEKEPLSWGECISHGGFFVEMMYFLYSRLYFQDSEFLQSTAQNIRNKVYEDYKTFIHEEAIISPKAFIKENCIIEKATIGENVYLTNCIVNDDAIIEENCTIDSELVTIAPKAVVKSGTLIKGKNIITVQADRQ